MLTHHRMVQNFRKILNSKISKKISILEARNANLKQTTTAKRLGVVVVNSANRARILKVNFRVNRTKIVHLTM